LAVVGLLYPEVALLGFQDRYRLTIPRHLHQSFHRIVVRSAHVDRIDEPEVIAGNGEAAAGLERHVFLDLVAFDTAGADGEQSHAQMGDRHAQQRRGDVLTLAPPAYGFEQCRKNDPETEAQSHQSHQMERPE
jgi:hypothetical protein